MSGQVSLGITNTNISQTQTIVPRLDYSNNLIAQIIDSLNSRQAEIKKSNRLLLESDDEKTCRNAIDLERAISFCLESLYCIQRRMHLASRIDVIPTIFPSMVPMIRIISAQLIDILPKESQQLSELSVHLGSILLDSASITKAQFDFSQSNLESWELLDEVKLIVDSKLNKQYPHLDFLEESDS